MVKQGMLYKVSRVIYHIVPLSAKPGSYVSQSESWYNKVLHWWKQVIRGFTFALLLGVIVGTYSSLFIATPVVYDTIKKDETIRVLKGTVRK